MVNSRHLSVFVMVTSLAALCSDAGISSESVCIGESVEVFKNIASPNFKIKISLYKTSADREDPIGVWFVQNSSIDVDSIRETYKAKLFFENGTILIRNISATDEATYKILYDIAGHAVEIKVQIYVLAPPTEKCKLKITHEEKGLIASLDNPEDCGKPIVSICWIDSPSISCRSKSMLELLPGKEAGTYYACFEGDALKCAKNTTEWKKCQNHTIGSSGGNNSPPPSPHTSYWIVGIVAIVLLVVIIILSMKLRKSRTRQHRPVTFLTDTAKGQGDDNSETVHISDSTQMDTPV